MNCCNGNCDQGRNCPLREREESKPGDIWIILAMELAPIVAIGVACAIGGRIAGIW